MSATVLFVAAVILTVVMLFAWRGLHQLRSHLKGQPGYQLVSVTFVVVTAMVLAQIQSLISSTLILVDRAGTLDYRISLFLVAQIAETAVVLWAFWTLKRMEDPKQDL